MSRMRLEMDRLQDLVRYHREGGSQRQISKPLRMGLIPLHGDEPVDLYEVIRQRYERAAGIITSNRTVDEWYPLFRDNLLASAALDRLRHHAHRIDIEGDSFRAGRDPQPA